MNSELTLASLGDLIATMSMFNFSGGFVPVRDLDAAARWYVQTFACHSAPLLDDEGQRTINLYFEEDGTGLLLGPTSYPPDDSPPIIYTGNAAKAYDYLSRKNVLANPVQQDAQGTKFFEIRDCDGNMLEVSEEP